MIRRIALLLIAALALGINAQAARKLTREENDSVVNALATIWGKYLRDKAEKNGSSAENADYMRGLTDALRNAHTNDAYYNGMQDGIVIDSRLTQIEQMAGFPIDRAELAKAFERAAKGRRLPFTPATADRYMNYIITAASADDAIKERSEAFMDSIEKKPGVKKEMSGLMWEVLEPSDGPKMGYDGKSVQVTYVGRLFDGKVFDEHNAERPTTFRPTEVIPGFSECLYIVPKGATYRFYLPPEIAYGEAGVNGVIPPNCALVFDVKMIDFSTKE